MAPPKKIDFSKKERYIIEFLNLHELNFQKKNHYFYRNYNFKKKLERFNEKFKGKLISF